MNYIIFVRGILQKLQNAGNSNTTKYVVALTGLVGKQVVFHVTHLRSVGALRYNVLCISCYY